MGVIYMQVRFINLTPHQVTLVDESGNIKHVIPQSGTVLRLAEQIEPIGELDGIQIVRKRLAGLEQLPKPQAGVYYIVSLPIAQIARRPDFVVPDDLVRDSNGTVIGCRRLAIMA